MKITNLIPLVCLCSLLFVADPGFAKDKMVVAFAQDNMAYVWKKAQISAIDERFSHLPDFDFIFSDAGGQADRQVQNIEDHVRQGIDLLIVSPVDYQSVSVAIEHAHETGIPVIYAVRRAASDHFVSYIHPDDRAIAAQAADFVARSLPEVARVLMVQGVVTSNTVKNRREGFLESIDKHPHASVVAIKDGFYTQVGGIAAIDEALKEKLDFNAIYVHSDQMMSGVRVALKANGIDLRSLLTISFDYTPEVREAIRTGEQTASMTYPIAADEIVDTCVKVLKGQTVPEEIVVPSQLISLRNVDSVPTVFE